MVVPNLKIDEELHETNAALDEPPRDEAAAAVAVGLASAEAVHFFGGFGFLIEVECVAGLELHAGGEFVAGHARIEPRLPRALGFVFEI